MSSPGAVMSTWAPCCDSAVLRKSLPTAPTPTTPGVAAGYSTWLALSPLFPTAAKTNAPFFKAYFTAAVN